MKLGRVLPSCARRRGEAGVAADGHYADAGWIACGAADSLVSTSGKQPGNDAQNADTDAR